MQLLHVNSFTADKRSVVYWIAGIPHAAYYCGLYIGWLSDVRNTFSQGV
jgi:hypothetical protein